ncbi:hypothetical protein E4U13_003712 [Claviceps humidiphila]|uniref:O-methyltransferase C-terminal domain-containing protein n=1 Tax=Claviceps humidiphila TaxID=1294629 RepID=A0A9P7U0Z5_9HYPO|nr:hypothetical protein E4U13_003712 [Claviceps humidiphila]
MGNFLATPDHEESQSTTTTAPSVDRLTLLAGRIGNKTQVLTQGLRARGLLAPSYEVDGCADFPIQDLDAETAEARQEVLALTKELRDLVLGPREGLKLMAIDMVNYIPLHAIYIFKIAQAVPPTGSISYEQAATQVHALSGHEIAVSELRRLLRLAVANNLFCEPQVGHVAHNCSSRVLLKDEALASWIGLFTEDLFLPIGNTVAAMRKWPGSEEPTETAINVSYGHQDNFFDHTQSDTARARRYELSMKAHGSREGFDVVHTVQSYPWAKLGKATVVDVGGSQGHVSMALAEQFPSLSFQVQDLPGLRSDKTRAHVPAHLSERVLLTTHDFFHEQPIVADAYLLRHVLHAFPDKAVVQILQQLRPALRPGARIIINDAVLPAPGSVSPAEERNSRLLDVLMKTVCNGREREASDWRAVLERADARFVWQGAWKSSGNLWFVEAVWEGDGNGHTNGTNGTNA